MGCLAASTNIKNCSCAKCGAGTLDACACLKLGAEDFPDIGHDRLESCNAWMGESFRFVEDKHHPSLIRSLCDVVDV